VHRLCLSYAQLDAFTWFSHAPYGAPISLKGVIA